MNNIYIIIIFAIIILGILILNWWIKSSVPNFKSSRIDELTDCQDYCFEQYPYQWQFTERQKCITNCLKPKQLKQDWIDNFNTCLNNKCGNKEKCMNTCDTTILPPINPVIPDPKQYSSDEEYQQALDKFNTYDFEYKSKLYPDYLLMKESCYAECNSSDLCRQKCCEEAKMCDSMKDKKEMENCKLGCSMMRLKRQ